MGPVRAGRGADVAQGHRLQAHRLLAEPAGGPARAAPRRFGGDAHRRRVARGDDRHIRAGRELAPLRVNVVSPGLVDTPAYDGMPAAAKAALFETAAESLPVGRTGQAEDIAPAVEMLITSGFATGVLLDIDGGARTPL